MYKLLLLVALALSSGSNSGGTKGTEVGNPKSGIEKQGGGGGPRLLTTLKSTGGGGPRKGAGGGGPRLLVIA